LGYSTETYRYHIGASVTGRLFYVGEPSELESDLSLGLNVQALGSSGHIKWKTALIQRSDASYTLRAGPVLYWRLSDTYHAQLLIKHDLLDRRAAGEDGQRTSIRVGLAAVF
jgi:hypothetical protein